MSKNEVYCAISFLERVFFSFSVYFLLVKSCLNEVFSHCYLSFCLSLPLSLSVGLSVCSSYWPALKRSSLQNFSVNGHFAHYKPTKKKWDSENPKPKTLCGCGFGFSASTSAAAALLCSARLGLVLELLCWSRVEWALSIFTTFYALYAKAVHWKMKLKITKWLWNM